MYHCLMLTLIPDIALFIFPANLLLWPRLCKTCNHLNVEFRWYLTDVLLFSYVVRAVVKLP